MKKKILLTAIVLFIISAGILLYQSMHKSQQYMFSITLPKGSRDVVQIYKGRWVDTGGSAFDYTGKIQFMKNGKVENFPMAAEEQIDASGKATFMLPAGQYFVYISNPIYDDELPRDITIPQDTMIIINSYDRH